MQTTNINLTYDAAKNYLNDADIILFRGKGVISKAIRVFSGGMYTHVGIVSYSTNMLELLEFREFKGARAINLEREIKKHSGQMDVFRCIDKITRTNYSIYENRIVHKTSELNKMGVIKCMRQLLGANYDYGTIWSIFKRQIPIIRWLYNGNGENEDVKNKSSKVCSTSVAHCFSSVDFDLVPNKSNYLITPTDISRSSFLSYLFTLV